jgi:hypothetical protein
MSSSKTPSPVTAPRASSYDAPSVVPVVGEEVIYGQGHPPFVVRGGTAFPVADSWTMRAVHQFEEQDQAPIGSSGKRHTSQDPLTEHDIAERISRAAARYIGLLMEAENLGMKDLVRHSRYIDVSTFKMVQEETAKWQTEQ